MTEEESTSGQKDLVVVLNVLGFVALITFLVLGTKVAQTTIWISNHPEHVPEYIATIAEPFKAKTYVNSRGDSLQYRLMMPLEYDSSKKYPLVVSLHGSGGRGTDNARQLVTSLSPHLLSKPENRKKYPAFLFVPQCPPRSWWGGISGLPGVDSILIESILALEKEFSIDENRRYLTGVSMGGYGTWHLIGKWPQMFAAAVPIAGEGDPAIARNMINVPLWAFHGAKDGNVPVSGSREMIEAIKKAGGDPRYTEYPDGAHNIGEQIINTPELLDWLFAQERE